MWIFHHMRKILDKAADISYPLHEGLSYDFFAGEEILYFLQQEKAQKSDKNYPSSSTGPDLKTQLLAHTMMQQQQQQQPKPDLLPFRCQLCSKTLTDQISAKNHMLAHIAGTYVILM